MFAEFQKAVEARSLSFDTYSGALRVHKTLTRLQSFPEHRWSSRLDAFLGAYEKEDRGRKQLLNRTGSILVNRFRRKVLDHWLDQMQVIQDQRARNIEVAIYNRTLNLCRRGLDNWTRAWEERLCEGERSDIHRRQTLLSRYLVAWRGRMDRQRQNVGTAVECVQRRFLRLWAGRTQFAHSQDGVARRMNETWLKRRKLTEMWRAYCTVMADKRHDHGVLQRTMDMWALRTSYFYALEGEVEERYSEATKEQALHRWMLYKQRTDALSLTAASFNRTHTLQKALGIWARALELQNIELPLVEWKQRRVAKAIFRRWRARTLARLEAREFQRYFTLRICFKEWRDETKLRRWQRLRDSVHAGNALNAWRLELRGRFMAQNIDMRTAQTVFKGWSHRTEEAFAQEEAMLPVADELRDRTLLSRMFDTWYVRYGTQNEREAAASFEAEAAMRASVLEKMMAKLSIHDTQYDTACIRYRQHTLRWVFEHWKKGRETRRVRNVNRLGDEIEARRSLALKEEALTLLAKRHRAYQALETKAADSRKRKLLQQQAIMFDQWYWRWSANVLREAEASEMRDVLVLHASFQTWAAKKQHLDDLIGMSIKFGASLNAQLQARLLRQWRLRTLKSSGNRRLADDLQTRLARNTLRAYFKRWAARSTKTSEMDDNDNDRSAAASPSPPIPPQPRSAPRLRLAGLASPAIRTPTRPPVHLPMTSIRPSQRNRPSFRSRLAHARTADNDEL